MEPKRLIITPLAIEDLRGIRRYIARTSPHCARAFLSDLTAKIAWIAEVDFTGSPRDHVAEGLRGPPYRDRCIYFRTYPDRIVILRVLHGAQDVGPVDFGGGERARCRLGQDRPSFDRAAVALTGRSLVGHAGQRDCLAR
ncbi:MAG: type II toxin-antitoxin system RelE/ParE family toxin [Rhizobium sp.]|nr:type II toxin-antitoxin system RelE/ParE family toxin [Rhizobium sp.]